MKKIDSLIEAIHYFKTQGEESVFWVDSYYLLRRQTFKNLDVDYLAVESTYRLVENSGSTRGSKTHPNRHKNKEIKGLLWNLRRSTNMRSHD